MLIPQHTRTITVRDHYDFYKFKLKIPDMELFKIGLQTFAYYPIDNNVDCYSPFLNTYESGEICLGVNISLNTEQALETIYNTNWGFGLFASAYKYVKNAQMFRSNYLAFLQHWQDSEGVKLIPNSKPLDKDYYYKAYSQ